MKNKGLFSSIFIDEIREEVELDDNGRGRMATLAQKWQTKDDSSTEKLWNTFLKQAVSYLQFIPPVEPSSPDIYLLKEDYNSGDPVAVLYFVAPQADFDDLSVGRFWPGKLVAELKNRSLNWGILTNGAKWCLYSLKTAKPYEDFVELDLLSALKESDEKEYGPFERFFHRNSFVKVEAEAEELESENHSEIENDENGRVEIAGVYKCRLDSDAERSEEILEELVKAPLLSQVDEILQYVCNGFIVDTERKGTEYTEEERREIFESAVKLLYRCLFLFYAEARSLLPSEPEKAEVYRKHSIRHLCEESRKFRWNERKDTDGYDLWRHLKGLVNAVNEPARPECTSAASSWGTSDWLKWSKDYLPFRQWQSATGTSDSEVERMVQGFSDWYVKEYTNVHQNGSLSLVHVMTGWQSSILKDELSVIVVADCVPVDFWDNLKICLSRSGFRLHAQDYRFAPLPTETAVSKPMMIAGQWDLISKPYNILLQMRSKTDWAGRNVRYFGDLKDLAACDFDREPIVLLLNFLPTDELLHGDVSQINSTYEEEANRVFARLAESLREVVDKWPGPKDRVGLYVATDHGATKILPIEAKSLDSKVVTKLFTSPKYRFAEVLDAEAYNIPENLWELGYRFKQPFADKSATYFIPKGHNTVASGSPKRGFMHGGATPEEVIVPAGSFRLSKPAWKMPAARFLELRLDNGVVVFYVQRLNTISMAIQNPNREPIVVRDIRILTTGSEVRKCSRPTVPAESEEMLSLECLFRPESKGQVDLNVQIEYTISGEEQAISLTVKAVFKSAQTGGFQLKDLV